MGMFDVVVISCPKCGKDYDIQSKGGDCILAYYNLPGQGPKPAPEDVMSYIDTSEILTCSSCETKFMLKQTQERIVQVIQEAVYEIALCPELNV